VHLRARLDPSRRETSHRCECALFHATSIARSADFRPWAAWAIAAPFASAGESDSRVLLAGVLGGCPNSSAPERKTNRDTLQQCIGEAAVGDLNLANGVAVSVTPERSPVDGSPETALRLQWLALA
jgi:hypothetical protein